MSKGVDLAGSSLSGLACLAAAGYEFVARYYNTNNPKKNLTRQEAEAIGDAGLSVVAVWENGFPTKASYFTRDRGASDAQAAHAYAAETIAQPPGTAIYFAVDYDATAGDVSGPVTEYFRAIHDTFVALTTADASYTIGVYGSGAVCVAMIGAGLARYGWLAQSTGWRGYKSFADWSIKQGKQQTVCGLTVDVDEGRGDYGAFRVAVAAATPAATATAAARAPARRRTAAAKSRTTRSRVLDRGGPGATTPAAPAAPAAAADPRKNLEKVDHIVVLMLENRSFDHMLGYLSLEGGRADIEGLQPRMKNEHEGVAYEIRHLTKTTFPADPCHRWQCVADQINWDPTGLGAMDGFVRSYAQLSPRPKHLGAIMGYYNADDLPMYDFLAREFVVCDHWFSAIPGPTMPNRVYSLSGESNGDAKNRSPFPPPYGMDTIFDHLRRAGRTHHYYAGDYLTAALRLFKRYFLNVREIDHMSEFYKRARAGKLPSVSWIDPDFGIRFKGDQNDDHPPVNVRRGQRLVRRIYEALRAGKDDLWLKTLFIITYDEHGGFFDHVPPPPAQDDRAAESPWIFGRRGVRVPAFVISPWVERGASARETYDHTSILKTILERFCVRPDGTIPRMTRRVESARGLADLLSLATPRTDAAVAPVIEDPQRVSFAAASRAAALESAEGLGEMPAPADHEDDDYHGKLLQLRAAMLREGLPADKLKDAADDTGELTPAGGRKARAVLAPLGASSDVAPESSDALTGAPSTAASTTALDDAVRIRVGALEISIPAALVHPPGVRGTAETPRAATMPPAWLAAVEAPAGLAPALRPDVVVVPADKVPGGFGGFEIRPDFAESYQAAYAQVKALGGVITSLGALRRLDAEVTPDRSPTSLHYTGRAIDLYTKSGMQGANDPYIVVRDGGSDDFPRWEVFCVSATPDPSSPLYDESLIAERELVAAIWEAGTGVVMRPRRARCFSLTRVLRQNGWLPIPSRSKWRARYLSLEWWHFQNQAGLVDGVSRFGDELEKVWPADAVVASRLTLDAVWRGQGFR
ncbi:MAG: alkaline phosphatase family protein [Gemmatimonadaceae bacterium]